MISVIIPTLDAGERLQRTLESLQPFTKRIEVLVVDTGDTEDTATYAGQFSWVHWLRAKTGRGPQQIAGAEAATGDIFLFLHSDTTLDHGWIEAVEHAVNQPEFNLGYFRLKLKSSDWKIRVIEQGVAWRCRLFQLPYGDQSLFTTRSRYVALGGFPPIPLMEDVELVWKARTRGRLTYLPLHSISSADKWERDGVWKRTWKNWTCYRDYKRQHRDAWELAKNYEPK